MIELSVFQLICLMCFCWGFGGFCGELMVVVRYGGTNRIERALATLERED